MRIGASARDRLLRRHAGEVDRLCLLALGDAARARAAAAATMELAAAGLAAGVRPPDGRPWLLGLAIAECDRRSRAPSPEAGAGRSDDPWGPARRLPARERAALILHEGLGLGVRRTATALGVEWRAVTDLLFSARRTLARPGDRWEPLECTVHRRRLSDAGCPRVPPALSRAHVEGCEGCRGMLSASAERRARARPAAPAPASRPRLRLARPGLALAAACAAILVGGAATLIGGGELGALPGDRRLGGRPERPGPRRADAGPRPRPAGRRPAPPPRASREEAPRPAASRGGGRDRSPSRPGGGRGDPGCRPRRGGPAACDHGRRPPAPAERLDRAVAARSGPRPPARPGPPAVAVPGPQRAGAAPGVEHHARAVTRPHGSGPGRPAAGRGRRADHDDTDRPGRPGRRLHHRAGPAGPAAHHDDRRDHDRSLGRVLGGMRMPAVRRVGGPPPEA